jgi:hypothetical protein
LYFAGFSLMTPSYFSCVTSYCPCRTRRSKPHAPGPRVDTIPAHNFWRVSGTPGTRCRDPFPQWKSPAGMRTMSSVSFVFFTWAGFGSASAAYCSPAGGSSVPERIEGTNNRKETTKDRKHLELNVERCFRISNSSKIHITPEPVQTSWIWPSGFLFLLPYRSKR